MTMMNNNSHAQNAQDEQAVLDLLQHARDAELLERVVLTHSPSVHSPKLVGEPLVASAGRSNANPSVLGLIRRAGAPLAAAAAVVGLLVWIVVSRPAVTPSGGSVAVERGASGNVLRDNTSLSAGKSTPSSSRIAAIGTADALATVSAKSEASSDFSFPDMSLVADLDPNAEYGLPSLTEPRRMVIAVPVRLASSNECVDWGVVSADAASVLELAEQTNQPERRPVLESAVVEDITQSAIACAADSRSQPGLEQVVLFEVEGPRMLLPFHDDDARAMAACLTEAVEIEQAGGSSFVINKCAQLAGICVPSGLAVTATLVSR